MLRRFTPLLWAGWALVVSTAPPTSSEARSESVTVAPGLKHITLRRGTAARLTRYRVLVGPTESQRRADELLARIKRADQRARPHYRGGRYYIGVNGLPDRAAAQSVLDRLQSLLDSVPAAVQAVQQDITNPEGPWEIHVLEADPCRIEVEVAHAYDEAIGLETTSGLAKRRRALAAVNGGYFLRRGLYRGDSIGVVQINGSLVSEPDRGRGAVGFYEDNGCIRSLFGRLTMESHLRLSNGETVPLNGVNRRRRPAEIVVYTPGFHRTTLTPPDGMEVIVDHQAIHAVLEQSGSSLIPHTGYVVSFGGDPARRWRSRLRVGQGLEIHLQLISPVSGADKWNEAPFILGGGPLLLLESQRVEDPKVEAISRVFFLARHPRTAVGVRSDGTLLFVTVDGRHPAKSVGMSLEELTDLFVELGAVSAVNLDGGGSTTMVVQGKPVNTPSDPTGERPIANAVLLFSRPRR